MKRIFIFIFIFLVLSANTYSETIYVNDNAGGANNGTSWDDAYTSFQSALDAAQSGDKIWVAKGTYKPSYDYGLGRGSRGNHFRMIHGVEIYGGFAGTETAINQRTDFGDEGANETILSGDLNGDDIISGSGATLSITNNSENCYHVFYNQSGLGLTNTDVLNGFTICGGNADIKYNGGDVQFHFAGAGIYNFSNSPTITNCTITGNMACYYGGGVYNGFNSNPAISNCIISGNSASSGGGVYNISSTPTINNCSISRNFASSGGGIANDYESNTSISNCTIISNKTSMMGGGFFNSSSILIINNSIIWDNTSEYGNQFFNLGLNGTSIIYLNYSCYSNESNDLYANGGSIDLTNNNIIANPYFVNIQNHDYRLRRVSPCVNAGNNTYNSLSTDIRGLNRVYGEKIDMGAMEWTEGVDIDFTPTVQASQIKFSNISRTGMTIRWTRGNGDASLLLGKMQYRIATAPLNDCVAYDGASPIYTAAPTVGGAKLLYNGTDATPSVVVTGLTKYKLYNFKVCEYNDLVYPYYQQSENATNPRSRWTLRKEGEDNTVNNEFIYPNPASTEINYDAYIPETSDVRLEIFSTDSKLIKSINFGRYAEGNAKLTANISELMSGTYLAVYHIGAESFVALIDVVK